MRVHQIVSDCLREASGPSYSVPGLCRGLIANGVSVTFHALSISRSMSFPFTVKTYPWHRFPSYAFGRSPEMLAGLRSASVEADIFHTNGLWMLPNVYSSWAIRNAKCKLVTSPRGSLARWSLRRSYWKKRLFVFLFRNVMLRHADMFHATSDKEYEEIRAQGYRQPVAIVPIGMDLPEVDINAEAQRRRGAESLRKILFFGRLHKVKGVDRLVRAWEKVVKDGWELVIAGPDCGMLEVLKGIVAEEHVPRVSFVGEINGLAKYEFLAGGDIYVLPSDTENFGVTVTEALVSGTPVIASQGTPWQGLERERCGKWVPIGVEPLAAALKEMMAMSDEERAAMGARGREWIRRDFSWKGIGAKMKAAYEWLLGQGDKPEWVVSG